MPAVNPFVTSGRPVIVIPAYNPDHRLPELVAALGAAGCTALLVVNDGSDARCAPVFAAVAARPGVTVLTHAVNLGKGRALKTAFNWLLCERPDAAGVVTADADGQHAPEDILRVADALAAAGPDEVVLGARAFGTDVPLRSRMGNIVTRHVMGLLYGARLSDTQTGLRGIPMRLLPQLLAIAGERYEYEVGMLVHLLTHRHPIRQVEIRTIYLDGNRSSHFNPVLDSMRIYFVLLRFFSSSMLTAFIDFVCFAVALRVSGEAFTALATGRVCAIAFNYTVNRRFVFRDQQSALGTLPLYVLTVAVLFALSYLLIREITLHTSLGPLAAKVIAESLLFFVSFAVQRVYVFGQRARGAEAP